MKKKLLFAAVMIGVLLLIGSVASFAAKITMMGEHYELRSDGQGSRLYRIGHDDEFPALVSTDPYYLWLDGYCYCFKDSYLQRNTTMPGGEKTDSEGRWINEDGSPVRFGDKFPDKEGSASTASTSEFQADMNRILHTSYKKVDVFDQGSYNLLFSATGPADSTEKSVSSGITIGKEPFYGIGNLIFTVSSGNHENTMFSTGSHSLVFGSGVRVSILVYYKQLHMLTAAERQAMDDMILTALTSALGTDEGHKMYQKLINGYNGIDEGDLWYNEYGQVNDQILYHYYNGLMAGGTNHISLEFFFHTDELRESTFQFDNVE